MNSRFAIKREDGRSNTQVIVDLVQDAEPGQVFTYDELADALEKDASTQTGKQAVQAAVLGAVHSLEKLYQRTLTNVRGLGYRLVPAREHMTLACIRNDRANRQMRKGLHTLQHVRYQEMDDNERRAHEGHLMITAAIYQQTQALERRMRQVEEAIKGMQSNESSV